MINIAPRTYHEVVRLQKCYTLAAVITRILPKMYLAGFTGFLASLRGTRSSRVGILFHLLTATGRL